MTVHKLLSCCRCYCCCFMWVWNLVSHIEGSAKVEGVRIHCTNETIWINCRSSGRLNELHLRSLIICTLRQILLWWPNQGGLDGLSWSTHGLTWIKFRKKKMTGFKTAIKCKENLWTTKNLKPQWLMNRGRRFLEEWGRNRPTVT